jgi:hypothetical protein
MSEIPQLPPSASEAVRPARPSGPSRAGELRPTAPAFEALLERLEAHASELQEKSKALSGPAELPGAVDTARVSLEEALHLGEELLEAYRAARSTPEQRP